MFEREVMLFTNAIGSIVHEDGAESHHSKIRLPDSTRCARMKQTFDEKNFNPARPITSSMLK